MRIDLSDEHRKLAGGFLVGEFDGSGSRSARYLEQFIERDVGFGQLLAVAVVLRDKGDDDCEAIVAARSGSVPDADVSRILESLAEALEDGAFTYSRR
ncbi:hypothetical protein [Natronosalvus caseinilyticus]|uniref:hypothetical protein n=1 Tax=Natronosalvus caseinilyticus TaxID=2953747 RepID=UPI0028A9E6F8|nr:hypothetical protein [Natronosalvus caseinilyticus]